MEPLRKTLKTEITHLDYPFEIEIRWEFNNLPKYWEGINLTQNKNNSVDVCLLSNKENIDYINVALDPNWIPQELARKVKDYFGRLFDANLDFYPLTVASLICSNYDISYDEIVEKCTVPNEYSNPPMSASFWDC